MLQCVLKNTEIPPDNLNMLYMINSMMQFVLCLVNYMLDLRWFEKNEVPLKGWETDFKPEIALQAIVSNLQP